MRRPNHALADAVTAKCGLAAEVLRSFGSLRFAATGWSMLPSVRPGDTLVVEGVSPDQIRVGDIALVGRNGTLCAHRVVSLPGAGNRFWITQGDAMPRPDQPVLDGDLLGRVTEFVRSGKSLAVPKKLRGIERLLGQILRRSVFAARVFVYMTTRVRTQRESLPCQG
jgi:signal peptidase I